MKVVPLERKCTKGGRFYIDRDALMGGRVLSTYLVPAAARTSVDASFFWWDVC